MDRLLYAVILSLVPAAFAAPANDSQMKDRIRGIREYAKQGTSTVIASIEPYLNDADLPVRLEAVKAISEIGTQRSLDPLVRATGDSQPEVQLRAVIGLINFYVPGHMRSGAKLSDENREVVDAYVTARPDVLETLGKLCRGGSSMEVRAQAARGLGILRAKPALPDLLESLKSKNSSVLFEVLIALQKIRDPESATKVQYLLRDLDDRVQIAAVETAGILRNREALGDLRKVVEGARNNKIRRAALTSLAMMPDGASREVFTQYFSDSDEGLRAAAAEGFGRLKTESDVPAIEKAFGEERKMSPRLSQAFALVLLGKRELSEFSPLQYLVNSLNSRFYRDSAETLLTEACRDKDVRAAVFPVLSTGNKAEKIRLARALGSTGDADAIPALDPLKLDPDGEIAQEAMKAIRNIQSRTL